MPVPPDAFDIPGGCNCGAIRYRIHVPEAPKRPLHPKARPSHTTPPTYFPLLFTDHCSDCRRSNGAIIPAWICQPLDWLDVELKNRSDPTRKPAYMSGERAFSGPHESTANTCLQYYESSPGCYRSFCARCGTHLSFVEPTRMPGILDIVLGTVDREVLEHEWMMPTRQNWCDLTIPRIKRLVEGGEWDKMGQHPKGEYNEYYGSEKT